MGTNKETAKQAVKINKGSPVPGMNRRWVIGLLFFVVFLDLLGLGILIPVIPLNRKFFDDNELVSSLPIVVYSLCQFIVSTFSCSLFSFYSIDVSTSPNCGDDRSELIP